MERTIRSEAQLLTGYECGLMKPGFSRRVSWNAMGSMYEVRKVAANKGLFSGAVIRSPWLMRTAGILTLRALMLGSMRPAVTIRELRSATVTG